MQSMIGAAGHLAAEMLVSADEEVARITQTIYEFEDPETDISDPRKEASEIMGAIRGSFFHRFGWWNNNLFLRQCSRSIRQSNEECDQDPGLRLQRDDQVTQGAL